MCASVCLFFPLLWRQLNLRSSSLVENAELQLYVAFLLVTFTTLDSDTTPLSEIYVSENKARYDVGLHIKYEKKATYSSISQFPTTLVGT